MSAIDLFILSITFNYFPGTVTQTDWSGDIIPGPVSSWENDYFISDQITAGQSLMLDNLDPGYPLYELLLDDYLHEPRAVYAVDKAINILELFDKDESQMVSLVIFSWNPFLEWIRKVAQLRISKVACT